jgi:transcriptional regulator with XRE-family HTH domain
VSGAEVAAEGRRPNPRRITMALDAKALYGPEVDRACGVEEPAVDLWESGALVPTGDQLAALAKLTGVTVEFFYGDDPPRLGVVYICSRSRRKGNQCVRVEPETTNPPPGPPEGMLF